MSAERVLTLDQLNLVFELLLGSGEAYVLESLGEFGERFETVSSVIVNAPLSASLIFDLREDGHQVIYPCKDAGPDSYQVILSFDNRPQLFRTEAREAVFFNEGGLDSAQAIVLEEQPPEEITYWTIMGAEMVSGDVIPIGERRLLSRFMDSLEVYAGLLTKGVVLEEI